MRSVLITGATGGLGPAVVRAFLQRGDQVTAVLHTMSEEDSREKIGEGLDDTKLLDELEFVSGDVTDEGDVRRIVEAAVENRGGVDVLVNLVGGYLWSKVGSTSLEDWQKMLDLNVTSAFLCSREVLSHMADAEWGRIINMSSRMAEEGTEGQAAYSAAKAAVVRLTQALDAELDNAAVTVNAVEPSIIDTPANRDQLSSADFSKWVSPESVARVILFLASNAANDISGASIPVFGQV